MRVSTSTPAPPQPPKARPASGSDISRRRAQPFNPTFRPLVPPPATETSPPRDGVIRETPAASEAPLKALTAGPNVFVTAAILGRSSVATDPVPLPAVADSGLPRPTAGSSATIPPDVLNRQPQPPAQFRSPDDGVHAGQPPKPRLDRPPLAGTDGPKPPTSPPAAASPTHGTTAHSSQPTAEPAPTAPAVVSHASTSDGQAAESPEISPAPEPAPTGDASDGLAPASNADRVAAADRPPDVRAADKIADGVQNAIETGGRTLRVRLDPPELGGVAVEAHRVEGKLTVRLTFESPDAAKLASDGMPALREALVARGLETADLEIQISVEKLSEKSGVEKSDATSDRRDDDSRPTPQRDPSFQDRGRQPDTAPRQPGGVRPRGYNVRADVLAADGPALPTPRRGRVTNLDIEV